jgi:hypothetical protein
LDGGSADIQAYDAGFDHMMMFADMLSDGIIKQNPNKVVHASVEPSR